MARRILHLASEAAPFSQSGGLGQVVGALPKALAAHGLEVSVLTPLYRSVADSGVELIDTDLRGTINQFGVELPVAIRRAAKAPRFFFLDCPPLYDREGLYADANNDSYFDNAARFAALCRAAVDFGDAMAGGPLDVVHAHDWQAGLAAPYLLAAGGPRSVFTIHNLAFQGVFDKLHVDAFGLDWSMFHLEGFEFYDQLSFLKAGAAFSDKITTVSPTYADEIQQPAFGHNLDGFFRTHAGKLVGILNGIDTDEWDPRTDPHIARPYSASRLAGKRAARLALGERFGIDLSGDRLVCGVVSRLAWQKGPDLIADVAPRLADAGAVLVVLGSGDPALEDRFRLLAEWFADNVAVHVGFSPALAHTVFAGSDAFLMPSRFEPCGLGQLIAMRYGTVPIVSAVGGLRDTVSDDVGVVLDDLSARGLEAGIATAARRRRDEPAAWRAMVTRGMERDWSWTAAATRYVELYDSVCEAPR